MDFSDAPEEIEFRRELREWLSRVVPALGSEPETLEDRLPRWRRWQQQLHEAGYAGLSWPSEHGGRGVGVLLQAIFAEECDQAGAPDRLNILGEGLLGPTLIDFGTDEQKSRFLGAILKGDSLWCQLFSEPNAGSDLAALQTKAQRDGNGWRINGQKVWSSRAQIADWGILLARTGAPNSKHRGITYFLLDMRQPGVSVRPLRHMLGGTDFNEVFIDNVWVGDDCVVGGVDDGWRIAMATLSYERVALATGRVNTQQAINDLVAQVREAKNSDGQRLGEDPVVRQKMADLYLRTTLQRLTGKRILSAMAEGASPGAEVSTAKLFSTALVEEIADFAVGSFGLAGQEDPDSMNANSRWLRLAYQARGTSIAGGSTFIQRNIVAERVLGLPKA
ncbi:MAG: acyl-CoA dehydrogenase [Betaproteobacteria bacterium HGW-Betaproteobacteria-5]|jgi:alkylation response protein AidB-like acyl-CoA dehydrogenase|nr:MAG: acyl-CoA dehydrogenase [Betaproteobacteria bacterium HGW-Betaproteobacteria-5]PKO41147.1 MAG: acyl-CoA dehydrogenase [Betaproteobacteria bacterium HGW-Betaproteobacteria-6]